jgi:N-acetylglucosamine-6-phosphate deacetylase
MAKRGAHDPNFIISAPDGITSFESVYGPTALAPLSSSSHQTKLEQGVRIITAAPEVTDVLGSISELKNRGITISIGHSIASSAIATAAIREGANLITHLFNAMPVLHHRDPGIVGLLGASPASGGDLPLTGEFKIATPRGMKKKEKEVIQDLGNVSEALAELPTPPRSPVLKAQNMKEDVFDDPLSGNLDFDRPFYEMIVDGVHSHPNSVRVSTTLPLLEACSHIVLVGVYVSQRWMYTDYRW